MRIHWFHLVLCCGLVSGCAAASDPATLPDHAVLIDSGAAVTPQQLGEALARRVEHSERITSQHAWKMARKALDDAKLTIDPGPIPDNKPLDAAGKAEWAARFRGWR